MLSSPLNRRILQGNLNHAAGAQNVFMQSMAELSIDIAVAAEPYRVPPSGSPSWAADIEGSVAIIGGASPFSLFSLQERGAGFVAVKWGEVVLFGVYFSPNRSRAEFEVFLSALEAAILRATSASFQIVLMGDLNAKSTSWGCPTTEYRGSMVEELCISTGLCLLNRGTMATCVRPQGTSIVDISFASTAIASRVVGWRVLDVETLSDHRYVGFELAPSQLASAVPRSAVESPFPRWALRKLDPDLFLEAVIVQEWFAPTAAQLGPDEGAVWFARAMAEACNTAMPKVKRRSPKQQVYWWSPELTQLRQECVTKRRAYLRQRRRVVRDEAAEAALYDLYREARKAVEVLIGQSKDRAWEERLEELNRDPWGRPYRTVRGKLRNAGPPLTESLEPSLLESVVAALFPVRGGFVPPVMASRSPTDADVGAQVPPITSGELGAAFLRIRSKKTAPGPDGVPARAWVLAEDVMEERFRLLLDVCLSTGRFPSIWKTGRLVLLKKEGRPVDSPSAYRPIVLLDEAGKLFERVIASRINHHLDAVGPDLAPCQFGFRQARSTVDAILSVKESSQEAVSQGKVVVFGHFQCL